MNSINQHLDSQDFYNLGVQLSSTIDKIVYVEGSFDQRLLMKATKSNKDTFIVTNGKNNLVSTFELFINKGKPFKASFIRDRDYDYKTDVSKIDELILTKYRDIECDLIFGDSLHSMIVSNLPVSKVEKFNTEEVIKAAHLIGVLRKHSDENKIYLDFKNLNYNSFFDGLYINEYQLCNYICQKNSNFDIQDDLLNLVKGSKIESTQYIICGEDFFRLFFIAIHKLDNTISKKPSDKEFKNFIINGSEATDLKYLVDEISGF